MKNLTYSLLFLFWVLGCSQNKENMINQNIGITSANLAEEISKQVQHYPVEKIYTLGYSNDKCYFDMYVDGIKLNKTFNKAIGNTAVEINNVLFASGKHKISFQLSPLGKAQEYEEDYQTLVDDTDLDFDLQSYDLRNENIPDEEHKKYSLPKKKEEISAGYFKEKFVDAGKIFYEGSFDINVDLPFSNKPIFSDAKDLNDLDRNELESMLLKKYHEIWSIYENKEYDNIAKLEYNSLMDLYVSTYEDKQIIKKNIDILFSDIYKNSTFKMQPIGNYKLQFFAGGKLVALMLETKDNRLRGNTALWAKVNYDGGTRGIFLNRYFYIPKGETELKVY